LTKDKEYVYLLIVKERFYMELAYRIDLRDALYTHGYDKVAKYFEDENYLLFYRSKVEKKLYRILKTIID
jgi:hypothetical protein